MPGGYFNGCPYDRGTVEEEMWQFAKNYKDDLSLATRQRLRGFMRGSCPIEIPASHPVVVLFRALMRRNNVSAKTEFELKKRKKWKQY